MCKKKTNDVWKISQKNTSKFHKFIHYGLKQKLRCWVLAPLFIGIILTVTISFSIVLYVEPTWFTITGKFKKESKFLRNQKEEKLLRINKTACKAFWDLYLIIRRNIFKGYFTGLKRL